MCPLRAHVLFGCLLLPGIAAAQQPTATIPPGHLLREGDSSHHVGWHYRSARGQYLYAPEAAGSTQGPLLLQQLSVRGDGGTASAGMQSLDIQIQLSSRGVTAWGSPSMQSFAANHGSDLRVFVARKRYSFPGWVVSDPTPRPFTLQFKGAAPFLVAIGAGLCVDLQFFSNSPVQGRSFADAVLASRYGSAVLAGAQAVPQDFLQYASGTYVGAPDFLVYGYSRAPGELAVQWLGIAQSNVPIPGSNAVLHTLPLYFHPVPVLTTQSYGRAQFSYGTPPPSLGLARFFSQMASFDGQGNMKLSQGTEIEIGVGPQGVPSMGCVYGYASGTRSFDPVHGAPMYAAAVGLVLGR